MTMTELSSGMWHWLLWWKLLQFVHFTNL